MQDEKHLKPLVSIIMSAYNAAKYIHKAIDSILTQTYENIEIVIADDGSSDETKALIDAYDDPRIKTYHNTRNWGYLRTCNKLFYKCKGDFITFQDADDWAAVDRIEKQLTHLLENPNIGANGTNFKKATEEGEELYASEYPLTHDEIIADIPTHFFVVGASIMIRREVLDNVGPYSDHFNRIGNEHLYWFYLITEKYKVANLPEHLYYYRAVGDSFSTLSSKCTYTHMLTNSILAELVHQRKSTGTDCFEKNNQIAHSQMIRKLTRRQKHRVRYAKVLAAEKKYRNASVEFFKAIFFWPFQEWGVYKGFLFNLLQTIKGKG